MASPPRNHDAMAKPEPIFRREIFQFFKDLSRHNKKTWMDANRERYEACVVRPFRRLLEETAPAVLALDERFDTTARNGKNFSRINRDIRFAKDKTPYRPQMYLKYAVPFEGGETGELYAGISAKSVTAGFRVYSGSKYKNSTLALFAYPRCIADEKWAVKQKKGSVENMTATGIRRRRANGRSSLVGRLRPKIGNGCAPGSCGQS